MNATPEEKTRAMIDALRLARVREDAEKQYAAFVASLNRITDRDIEENERARKP